MGSFAWEIETFGTKDKQLRISRGVINWLGVHPPMQNLPQKIIFCLFSRAWHEIKNRDWAFEQESRKTSFPLVCFLSMKFSDYVMDRKRPLSFSFSTLGAVSDQTGLDHMVFQWISDATLLFLMKMKHVAKCWKTTIFNFLAFLYWGARVVNFNWSLWDKT